LQSLAGPIFEQAEAVPFTKQVSQVFALCGRWTQRLE
jgi:hypothetical protein